MVRHRGYGGFLLDLRDILPGLWLSDIPAYNRANARMWTVFSVPFWASGLISFWWMMPAAVLLAVACLAGLPALIVTYHKIFKKYKRNDYE